MTDLATVPGMIATDAGGEIEFRFPRNTPDQAMMDDLMRIPRRRFVGGLDKRWVVPDSVQAREFVDRWGFAWVGRDALPDTSAPAPAPLTARFTGVTVESDGGYLYVSWWPKDEVKYRLIRTFNSRWVGTRWRVDLDHTYDVVEAFEKAGFEVRERGGSVLDQVRATMARIELSRALDADWTPRHFVGELRPFQRATCKYADETFAPGQGVIIGDEMGLGKTPSALALIVHRQAYPACLIVPASLKPNWRAEALDRPGFAPFLRIVELAGIPDPKEVGKLVKHLEAGDAPATLVPMRPGERVLCRLGSPTERLHTLTHLQQADLVIVNYDIIGPTIQSAKEVKANVVPEACWTPVLQAMRFKAIVADEAHNIKNRLALRTRALIELSLAASSDCLRIALTGSPVLNRRAELAMLLAFTGWLDHFGGEAGVKKNPNLARTLRATCFVAHLKKDVQPQLPARQYTPVYMVGDKQLMAEYQRAEDALTDYLAEKAAAAAYEAGEDPQDAAFRARWKASKAEHLMRINVLLDLSAKARYDAMVRWIKGFQETGEKLLAFGNELFVVDGLAEAVGAPTIQGKIPIEKRHAIVDQFQTQPDPQVVVLQIKAGGVGLTMTAASNVLMAQRPWSPKIEDQAVDRCYGRLNDPHGAVAWVAITEGCDIDQWHHDLLERKRVECENATDGDREDPDGENTSILGEMVDMLTQKGLARRR